jgi:hypothetical protein
MVGKMACHGRGNYGRDLEPLRPTQKWSPNKEILGNSSHAIPLLYDTHFCSRTVSPSLSSENFPLVLYLYNARNARFGEPIAKWLQYNSCTP